MHPALFSLAPALAFALAAAQPLASLAGPVSAKQVGLCDAPGFAHTLAPNAEKLAARAVWLDRALILWPGALQAPGGEQGSYKLYHAADAGIVARPGARISGASGAIGLTLSNQAPPTQAATRFKYLGPGPLLTMTAHDVARMGSLHRQQLVLVRDRLSGRKP